MAYSSSLSTRSSSEFLTEMEQSEFNDVRLAHGCVFRYMKERGLRLTEIAERGNMTKQSAGEVVDDLVELGYVERVPDPDDRRAKLVCLTERGEAAQAYGFYILAEIEKRWGERYGAERSPGCGRSWKRSPQSRHRSRCRRWLRPPRPRFADPMRSYLSPLDAAFLEIEEADGSAQAANRLGGHLRSGTGRRGPLPGDPA